MPESPKVVRELTELIFAALCHLRYLAETECASDQDRLDDDIENTRKKIVELRRMRTELEDLLARS